MPPKTTLGDYVQIVGLAVALAAAFISALLSSRTALLLAKDRGREERRQFCFHLQSQFDSPPMFECRYKAWTKLVKGDFDSIKTVSELLNSPHWTYEVSTVIHFFESLNRYCDEDLVDPCLAVKLFGRSYELWYQGVLARLTLDPAAESNRSWFYEIRAFHVRVDPVNAPQKPKGAPVSEPQDSTQADRH
jgi:hypothetical protein